MEKKDTAHLSIRPVPAEENGAEPIKLEQLEQNGAQAEPETPSEKKEEAPKGDFMRILKLGDSLDWMMMGICIVSALGAGIAMPLMFLVFGKLVNDFTMYFLPVPRVTKAQFVHAVNQNTLYMVYLGLARFILSYVSMLAIRTSGLRISARLRLAYLRALFRQPVSAIDKTSPGAIASRLTTNSNTIEAGISQQFSLAIQALAFTIGLYVVAFIKSAKLTLVASASMPVVLIAYGLALPFINKYYYQAEFFKEQASSLAFEILESIRVVVAFGAEGRLSSAHQEFLKQARKLDRKQAPLMGMMMAPMFLAVYMCFSLTFWFGIKQYVKGHNTNIGTITGKRVLFSILWAVMCLYRLYSPLLHMGRAAAASAEIFAVIDAEVPDTSGLKDPDVDIAQDIVFRDVFFAYDSRPDTIILNGLNLRLKAGKTTAIVGPSGSGKSTIVGLLERWYHPKGSSTGNSSNSREEADEEVIEILEKAEKGLTSRPEVAGPSPGIYVGETNLNNIDVKWWRSNIGLVQQEPFLFNDTIYSNVANGLAGTEWQDAPREVKLNRVEWACKEAFADEFISRLPQGYDTMVGQSGMKISGGQRQRLAIARAIVKDPAILILDEATSAIDVRTEKIVQKALDRVSKSRTTITIAHRLSTIKKADKIVVLRSGQLVEEGTHEELLQDEDGVYSGFVRAQAVEMAQEEAESEFDIEEAEQNAEADVSLTKDKSAGSPELQERKHKERGFLGSLGLLLYEQRTRWLLYTLTLLGAMGGGSTYPIQAYVFAKIISVFTLPKAQLIKQGNFWALMFCIQGIAVAIAFLVLGWASALISTAVSSYYRQEYLENILRKRIAFFDKEGNSPGTLTSRLSTDSTQLQQLLGGEMGMALVGILSIVGSIIISFAFGWKLSLVGILAIMPVVLVAGYFRVHLEADFERLNALVFAESSQFGSEAIGAFRTVTALIMEDGITDRFDHLLETHTKKALSKAKYSTVVFAFSDSADMLCQALCFWYGGHLLATREYNVVSFFVIYMAVVQSSTAAGMWFSFAPNIVEATAASNRIISVRPTQLDQEMKPQLTPGNGPVGIEFRDVHFSYEERNTTVLNGVNIKIEPGQFAAFVGASGSGKSTMISLLERFYDPSSGNIFVGDIDITEVEPSSYRKNLSLVAQESTLYEGTIRENVSLSVDESEVTDAAIQEVCESAQIHEFVSSLPDGYNTRIGPRGVALSGGQRQRLALARALLRHPQLLLLDEATSNLDSESEKLVQQAIEQAAGEGGRTVIAVAHRLATIQNADVIFVMGTGKVLEQGDHWELLRKRGVYYQMCQAQALDR